MIVDEGLIRDYKRLRQKVEMQEKTIGKLRYQLKKIKSMEQSYKTLQNEYYAVIDANTRLVDIIKEYNPKHFGGGEGRINAEEDIWWS